VTTLTRWKLACALFAGIAGFATVSAHRGEPSNKPAVGVSTPRGGGIPQHLKRPLRISAEAAGISRTELIDRALSARTLRDLAIVTEKLGAVGNDDTINQLRPLLDDSRRGFPEAVLGVYGVIASEHAVDAILAYTKDDRPAVRTAAISALGSTQSARGEELLIALAQNMADPAQSNAISALASLGSDRVVAVLTQLSTNADYSTASSAVYALGTISTPAANLALRKLMEAQDSRSSSRRWWRAGSGPPRPGRCRARRAR
jgi:HEAT repeat protein